MTYENGVNWRPLEPEKRGRHATFASAVDAALASLSAQHDDFFDSLADRWSGLFPGLPMRPGRYEDGVIYLYVPNAPTNFAVRPKLPLVKRTLAALPGAPKKLVVKMEIRR